MKHTIYFEKSTIYAKRLRELFDALEFHEKRTRSEWRDKLFKYHLVEWGTRSGVWRCVSADKKVQIVGTDTQKIFQENLAAARPVLLQQALVMMLAAVDKILHQATTTKKFVQLLRSGKLDDIVKNFAVSDAYGIAMESRKRRGRGGKIQPRPANRIKEVVSVKLYELSFLGTSNLEKICAANGVNQVFTAYAKHLKRKSPELLKKQWSLIYRRRNTIVHECNVLRTKISPKKIRFEAINPVELKKDLDFVEDFGKFLAEKLS